MQNMGRDSLKLMVCLILFLISTEAKQDLQEQEHSAIEPTSYEEHSGPDKETGKRTIFGHHGQSHLWGKHVGIHPSGFKYVLGFGPLDVKYVPVIKPFAVFKPVIHAPIKFKPTLVANPWFKTYFPPHKPLASNEWRPIIKPSIPVLSTAQEAWKPTVAVESPAPVVHFPPPLPPPQVAIPAPIPPPPVYETPITEIQPSHHHIYFQTPISKPILPQAPLLHVAKPPLPVLPFGATFPAPVIQSPPQILTPSIPTAVAAPFQPQFTPSGFSTPFYPQANFPPPAVPVEHPPQPVAQFPPPAIHAPLPSPPLHNPQFSVPPKGTLFEFHGNHHLLANNQLPLPHLHHIQPTFNGFVPQIPPQPLEGNPPQQYFPQENFVPQDNREVQLGEFRPIHPGQTDLHIPTHLPQHPFLNPNIQGEPHHTFCLATGSLHCKPQ